MASSTINSIDEVISGLPKFEQILVKQLRAIILECLPKAEERSYYGLSVPFYRHHRLICFIWPPSIRMGPKKRNDVRDNFVVLGFNQGNKMAKNPLLLAEGRKQVYCMYIKLQDKIDEPQVRALLYEAGMIDEEFGRKRKKKRD